MKKENIFPLGTHSIGLSVLVQDTTINKSDKMTQRLINSGKSQHFTLFNIKH